MRAAQVRTVAASVRARLLACSACRLKGFRSRGVAAQEVLDSVLHVQLRRCDEHSSFLNLAIIKSVSRSGNFSMTQNAESRAHTQRGMHVH